MKQPDGWSKSSDAVPRIWLGCAGWSIPKAHAGDFPPAGSHLARYATVFPAVEIDSSFYRLHRESTYRAWAGAVPAGFRFAVKVPRSITHEARLRALPGLDEFLGGPAALGPHLGPLLVQLPPSLALEAATARAFFVALRARFAGAVVCEPRHRSWFASEGDELLAAFEIGRVAVDPPPVPDAAAPGGWRGISYFRLHGAPVRYRSSYPEDMLERLVARIREEVRARPVWVIFDNTASGAATANALWVLRQLAAEPAAHGDRSSA